MTEPEGEERVFIPLGCTQGYEQEDAVDTGRRVLAFCREQRKKYDKTNPEDKPVVPEQARTVFKGRL